MCTLFYVLFRTLVYLIVKCVHYFILQIIKKTISSRIKYDKEYANSLQQLTLINSKIDPPNFESTVYDVCFSY